jgi:GT2 family glycosyltransferase
MYMEDVDICRRIDQLGKKKLFYPKVEIIHTHRKGLFKKHKTFYNSYFIYYKIFYEMGF